jgi:hypothetical protein
MDSRWDSGTYKAAFLQCLPYQVYVQDMATFGLVDIPPELLKEMSDCSNQKQRYDTDAMQRDADHMNLKPGKDARFSQVQLDLGRAQEDFHMLAMRLRERAPNHTIFVELAFLDEVMDELESSQRS